MLKQKLTFFLICSSLFASAQVSDTISEAEVSRIISYLASDSLKGRGNYTPELHKAADFIAGEFQKDSLLPFQGSFFQPFSEFYLTKKQRKADANGKSESSRVLLNVIGVLEGRSRPNQAIIFSAHYDHLGIGVPDKRDKIYNGANDDASGVTALLALARYYSLRNDNERTLIFCAFSGEELGLLGSKFLAEIINPDSIAAVVNIEMIGTHKVSGKNSFFLTGPEHSNLLEILTKNLEGQTTTITGDKNIHMNLFKRSDNFPFAQKGIPAHTLMCSNDTDPCYHRPCDEVGRIDIKNMTEIIMAIPVAVRTLVNGVDTPRRINVAELE